MCIKGGLCLIKIAQKKRLKVKKKKIKILMACMES